MRWSKEYKSTNSRNEEDITTSTNGDNPKVTTHMMGMYANCMMMTLNQWNVQIYRHRIQYMYITMQKHSNHTFKILLIFFQLSTAITALVTHNY